VLAARRRPERREEHAEDRAADHGLPPALAGDPVEADRHEDAADPEGEDGRRIEAGEHAASVASRQAIGMRFAQAGRGNPRPVRDALILIDVVNRFDHEDADALLASFRSRLPAIEAAIEHARGAGIPVVYVNDSFGGWDGDGPGLVRSAVEEGAGGDVVERIAPQPGDPFILKPRYSGFDHTALDLLLEELGAERLLLAGAATEGCVVQTGIDARELGYKVTIVAAACATTDEELERLALRYAGEIGGIRVAGAVAETGDTED
jgi:nicotinamidase-related amidase